MSVPRTVALATVLFSVLACSSDSAGPAGPPPPESLTLDGDWSYFTVGLAGEFFGEPVSCTYEFDMTLETTGTTFTGSYDGALMLCFLFGADRPVDSGDGNILSGSWVGSAVQFDVDSDKVRNTGTLSASGMSGVVSVELIVQHNADIDTILVTGDWHANRR